jgi:sigma-E factor negative regulatory protein RseB
MMSARTGRGTEIGHTLAIAVLSFALSPPQARAAEDPPAWLERMSYAVDFTNYEGTMVHIIGGDTSVLKVTHRVENGRVTERISSDDDGGREIIRDEDEVTCIFPDQRTVLVEERDRSARAKSPLRGWLSGAGRTSAAFYNFAFAGSERVSGREARIVAIRPKDGYRYGYRLWLDRATAMPLKTQVIAEDGVVIEQILFTEIVLPERIPGSAVRPSAPTNAFSVRRSESQLGERGDGQVSWWPVDTPPGFKMAVHKDRTSPDSKQALQQIVFSDGLASVSLFIEPAVAAAEQAEGLSQVGAANAYTTTVDGHMVTAVGEVPARTVEMLARSARPVAGSLPR